MASLGAGVEQCIKGEEVPKPIRMYVQRSKSLVARYSGRCRVTASFDNIREPSLHRCGETGKSCPTVLCSLSIERGIRSGGVNAR